MGITKISRAEILDAILSSRLFPDKTSFIATRTRNWGEIISFLRSERCKEGAGRTDRILGMLDATSIRTALFGEDDYPEPLAQISDPPLLLFYRGQLPRGLAVGVVGSRRASAYGRQAAEKIASGLAERGVHVVSGLARGIDGIAHRGALSCKSPTTAVLGSGLTRIYPREHSSLAEEIIASGGCVMSEYPPGASPQPHRFPRRNRIIAGLSRGVLVVEASLRSGSLITARLAVDENRDVFAVPGSIFDEGSQGCHLLIRSGARLVTSAGEILEEYGYSAVPDRPREVVLSEDEWRIYDHLDASRPLHADDLVGRTGLTPPQVGTCLMEMELKGVILSLPGGLFVKKVV